MTRVVDMKPILHDSFAATLVLGMGTEQLGSKVSKFGERRPYPRSNNASAAEPRHSHLWMHENYRSLNGLCAVIASQVANLR